MEKKEVYTMLIIAIVVTLGLIGYCLFYGNQYVVMFDSNGSSVISKKIVRVGNKIEEPQAPTREGYRFLGWYADGEKYNFDASVRSNITLEAKWQKVALASEIYYVVSFDADGGSYIDEQYIPIGMKVQKPTNPVKDGYKFKGWYYNNTKYNFDKAVSQDLTLTAKWEKV